MTTFRLGDRLIGPDQPTYFIADIAANHDGDLDVSGFGTYGMLLANMKDASDNNSRRLRELVFPLNFQGQGLYKVSLNDDNDLVITDRCSGRVAVVTDKRLVESPWS